MNRRLLKRVDNALIAIEKECVKSYLTSGIRDKKTVANALFLLMVKAIRNLRAKLILHRYGFYGECDAIERVFLETFIFIQYFNYFPKEKPTVKEWFENPSKYFSESKYKIKKRIDDYWYNRYGEESIKDLYTYSFRFLSNISIHPTQKSAEECMLCAWSEHRKIFDNLLSNNKRRREVANTLRNYKEEKSPDLPFIHFFLNYLKREIFTLSQFSKYNFETKKLTKLLKDIDRQIEQEKTEKKKDVHRESR